MTSTAAAPDVRAPSTRARATCIAIDVIRVARTSVMSALVARGAPASLSSRAAHGDRAAIRATVIRKTSGASRAMLVTRCGNEYEDGLFAPIVKVARNVIGVKRFNQIRGKAISLHSQVIGDFCDEFGCDSKIKQGLIRTAKKNGGKLGFLA